LDTIAADATRYNGPMKYKGVYSAVAAYAIWGFLPLYWHALRAVPPVQVIGHRVVWSFAVVLITLANIGQWRIFLANVRQSRLLSIYLGAAFLIGFNWYLYVWAVVNDYVIETALGYFINPLLNVLLGVLVLKERLRPGQWLAIALAACGVLYLTAVYGSFPWIALSLAASFAIYALIKKLAPLGALEGMGLETGILFLPAVGLLLIMEIQGQGAFLRTGGATSLMLIGAGVATTIPLVLFASAARQVPLSLVGVLQYLAPTIQFLLGVFYFREPFQHQQLIGYVLVWLALVVFAGEGAWRARTVKATVADSRP
jgi:chloramphenicol-sensitive protein RarD